MTRRITVIFDGTTAESLERVVSTLCTIGPARWNTFVREIIVYSGVVPDEVTGEAVIHLKRNASVDTMLDETIEVFEQEYHNVLATTNGVEVDNRPERDLETA